MKNFDREQEKYDNQSPEDWGDIDEDRCPECGQRRCVCDKLHEAIYGY